MPAMSFENADRLKEIWTGRLVMVKPEKDELQRFVGRVGRIVTVNYSGKAIVDFADGAWYDIPANDDCLSTLAPDDPNRAKYDAKANSAQAVPPRQA
jgi:hypothetical protein